MRLMRLAKLVRPRNWPKGLPRKAALRAVNLAYLVRGRYWGHGMAIGRTLEQLHVPLVNFAPEGKTIVLNSDFLPDRMSLAGQPLETSPHHEFARQYLTDADFDPRTTRYYKLATQGRLPFPCCGAAQAEARCRYFIFLIHMLRDQGYAPQRHGPIIMAELDDGSFTPINGKHRLAALLALGARELPVQMCFGDELRQLYRPIVERSWPPAFYRKSRRLLERIGTPPAARTTGIEELIDEIRKKPLQSKTELYHPLPFHELRNLTYQVHPEAEYGRLWMILANYGSVQNKTVLDMGCNVGFYSFSLAKRGASVTGFELCDRCVDVATRVAAIYDMPATFVNKPVSPQAIRDLPGTVDLTLCLSMLQWVIDQEGMEYGRSVLRAISDKSDALFFDTSVNTGKACLKCKPGHEMAFVYDLLRESTSYKEIVHVGDVHTYVTDVRHLFFCRH